MTGKDVVVIKVLCFSCFYQVEFLSHFITCDMETLHITDIETEIQAEKTPHIVASAAQSVHAGCFFGTRVKSSHLPHPDS